MDAPDINQLQGIKTFLKARAAEVSAIYYEKGAEPFKKPMGFAAIVLVVVYFFLYSPLQSKKSVRAAEVLKYEVLSRNYQEYSDAKAKRLFYQGKLPLLKDKDEWLAYLITNSAKRCGINVDAMTAQDESSVKEFQMVSRGVTVATSYAKLGVWLADMENSPILLKVTDLSVTKAQDRVGELRVDVKFSTVFPRSTGGAI